ncbi:MAG TPA: hypothetical protein VIL99_08265, partial [Ignavibacteria bacterium]
MAFSNFQIDKHSYGLVAKVQSNEAKDNTQTFDEQGNILNIDTLAKSYNQVCEQIKPDYASYRNKKSITDTYCKMKMRRKNCRFLLMIF